MLSVAMGLHFVAALLMLIHFWRSVPMYTAGKDGVGKTILLTLYLLIIYVTGIH